MIQEFPKNTFFLIYSGSMPDPNVRKELDIKSFEGFKDRSTSYVNAVMQINGRMRVSALKNKIDQFNRSRASEADRFILRQQSQFDEEIMTINHSDSVKTLKKHGFYLRIKDAKECGDPTYFMWPSTSDEIRERDLIKELHIDMVKPSKLGGANPSGYSFEQDNEEDDSGAAGSPQVTPVIPAPPKPLTGSRKKRMARRINDSDDEATGVEPLSPLVRPIPSSMVPPVQPPAPALGPPPAGPAQPPMAVAVECIPRDAENADMLAQIHGMKARIEDVEKKLASLEETQCVLTSNKAVSQVMYNNLEARLKETNEYHAEQMKRKDEHYADLMKRNHEYHAEHFKLIKDNFMMLAKAKDEKYVDMFNAHYELIKSKDELIENLYQNPPKRPRASQ